MTEVDKRSYWAAMSNHGFFNIPPPLRPGEHDLALIQQQVRRWQGNDQVPRVLVMGSTPDFYFLPWPAGSDLLAVDRSQVMLGEVWPGDNNGLCEDWTVMSLEDNSRDVALCDGGLTLLPFPGAYQQVADQLARVLAPGGLFITRAFISGRKREDGAAVMKDFLAGNIANSSELKLRLAIALQNDVDSGVRLGNVWQFYADYVRTADVSVARLEWTEQEMEAISAYRDRDDRYCFPTGADLESVICDPPGTFEALPALSPEDGTGDYVHVAAFRRL